MNTDIRIFTDERFGSVRTMTDDRGEVWFGGRDVSKALGYVNASKAIGMHVDDEDKMCSQIGTPLRGIQQAVFINESGLYSLVLSSKLEQAKEFKRWVTGEVLPQIRKTGGYIPVKDGGSMEKSLRDTIAILQRTLDGKNALLRMKNSLIASQQDKVTFADAVVSARDSILIRDMAKLLTQNGVVIGQQRLFEWLRSKGYLFRRECRPKQRWVEKGLFDTTVILVASREGVREKCTTKVTGRGQRYFLEGFLSGRFAA